MNLLKFAQLNKIDIRDNGQDRFILNYGVNTDPALKAHPIVRMCRSLLVDGDGQIISRSFYRFFNFGEPDTPQDFNWNNFKTYSKEDGSLVILYFDDGWKIRTRKSFGDAPVHNNDLTWHDLFFDVVEKNVVEQLDPAYSYSFELCSPYNKIVKPYDEPVAYLLAAFNVNGDELNDDALDRCADVLRCRRPTIFSFYSLDDILSYLDELEKKGELDEGVVVKDSKNRRLKLKNKEYLRLHKLFGTFLSKKGRDILADKVLDRDTDEVLSYFPELSDTIADIQADIDRFIVCFNENRHLFSLQSQKEFALAVSGLPYRPLFFHIRKLYGNNVDGADLYSLIKDFKKHVISN